MIQLNRQYVVFYVYMLTYWGVHILYMLIHKLGMFQESGWWTEASLNLTVVHKAALSPYIWYNIYTHRMDSASTILVTAFQVSVESS